MQSKAGLKAMSRWNVLLVPAAFSGLIACNAPEDDAIEIAAALTQSPSGGTSTAATPPATASAIGGLRLAGLSFTDPDSSEWTTVKASAAAVTWPSPYDLDPHWVHIAWAPFGSMTSTEVWKLATGDGYELDLYVNGVKQTQGPDGFTGDFYVTPVSGDFFSCPGNVTCLGTSMNGPKLRKHPGALTIKIVFRKVAEQRPVGFTPAAAPSRGETRPVVVASAVPPPPVVVAWTPPPAGETSTGTVNPHPNPQSYFTAVMTPIFHSQSCSTCHSLGTKEDLVAHHHGLLTASEITVGSGPLGSDLRCDSGCHKPIIADVMNALPQVNFTETEWRVPGADMSIIWSTMTDKQICHTLAYTLVTADAVQQHFGADARIAWAVSSGALPQGLDAHATAPPHNYNRLQQIVSAWLGSGRRCPP